MATPKQRLEATHSRLTKLVPFAVVKESIVVNGKAITAVVGESHPYFDVDGRSNKHHLRLVLPDIPKGELLSIVEAVEQAVEQKVSEMNEFLDKVLEEKMPEIALEALTGGNSDLRDHFTEAMKKQLGVLQERAREIECPFESVYDSREFQSFSQLTIGIRIPHTSSPITWSCFNFADALNLFYAWNQVVAWVDEIEARLKAAAIKEVS